MVIQDSSGAYSSMSLALGVKRGIYVFNAARAGKVGSFAGTIALLD